MSIDQRAKEIHDESLTSQAIARAETRKRKNWGVVLVSHVADWAKSYPWAPSADGSIVIPPVDEVMARQFFGARLDAPVRRGGNPELFGVWRRLEAPMEGDEPGFISDPEPTTPFDPAVLTKTSSPPPAPTGSNDDD